MRFLNYIFCVVVFSILLSLGVVGAAGESKKATTEVQDDYKTLVMKLSRRFTNDILEHAKSISESVSTFLANKKCTSKDFQDTKILEPIKKLSKDLTKSAFLYLDSMPDYISKTTKKTTEYLKIKAKKYMEFDVQNENVQPE